MGVVNSCKCWRGDGEGVAYLTVNKHKQLAQTTSAVRLYSVTSQYFYYLWIQCQHRIFGIITVATEKKKKQAEQTRRPEPPGTDWSCRIHYSLKRFAAGDTIVNFAFVQSELDLRPVSGSSKSDASAHRAARAALLSRFTNERAWRLITLSRVRGFVHSGSLQGGF